ncbi:hypothetical protein ACJJTC_008308 [Scirpophaga incertulas]
MVLRLFSVPYIEFYRPFIDTLVNMELDKKLVPDAEAEDVLEKPPDDNPELTNMSQQNLNPGRFLTMHKRRKKKLLTRSLCQDSGLLDDMQFGQIKCILDQSAQWRFNAFTLDNVSGGNVIFFIVVVVVVTVAVILLHLHYWKS